MYPERQAIKMEKTNILNYIFLICLIDTFIGQYNGPAYIAHSTADCKVHTALHSLPIGHSTASTSWLYYFKIGLFCLIWIFVWLGIGLYICRFMRIVPAFVGFEVLLAYIFCDRLELIEFAARFQFHAFFFLFFFFLFLFFSYT